MELDRNCSTEENISDSRKEESEEGETTMLLVPAMNVGISANGEQGSRRKVQWNDRSGNNLVEVLEFEPRLLEIVAVILCSSTSTFDLVMSAVYTS
ncbi:hypothetical protein ZIOFF_064834 [Zingiber officinale]|uniref:Uncharacterized protein n=1 Tax=Zingiber officinale TaxID=94328 RepID=A0A8J5KAT3_ZINOF|nr:hypothetical protein ZIOFF_064834 [Zingiber officinale]